jgi:hypothetical protein
MTTEAGSEALRHRAADLVRVLGSLSGRLVHDDDTAHMQHYEFCDQAVRFADYVDSALLLSSGGRYAQAFSLLRSALDQWAADVVGLLGDRAVQLLPNATEDIVADAVRRWEAGELTRVVEEPRLVGRKRSTLRIVWRGLLSTDSDTVLHPIYFAARNYDPFYGPPNDQPYFADWLGDIDGHAIEQRRTYHDFFTWGSLVDSLVLNDIVPDRHRLHLNTHYRFVSAFVHSYRAAHELVAPSTSFGAQGMAHANEELVSLYAVQLSARYLRAFIAMTDRPPKVGLSDRDALDATAAVALRQSTHLWFLTDEPSTFDRWHELTVRNAEEKAFTRRSPEDLAALDPTEVRYYRNPLARLQRMHTTVPVEMLTGLGYLNPWQ